MLAFLLLVILALNANAHTLPSDPRLEVNIAGGNFVDIEDYPYQVAVIKESKLWCAGSIITAKAVLSAAHCVYNARSNLTIHAGSSFWDKPGSVHNVVSDATYGTEPNNDISVLRVAEPFTFDNTRQPVPLFKEGEVTPFGELAVVAGWDSADSDKPSNQLSAVQIPLVDRETCNKEYGGTVFLGELCAGASDKGPCSRDSGSALVVKGRQVGIVSVGQGCEKNKQLSIFTDVAYFSRWIAAQIS